MERRVDLQRNLRGAQPMVRPHRLFGLLNAIEKCMFRMLAKLFGAVCVTENGKNKARFTLAAFLFIQSLVAACDTCFSRRVRRPDCKIP
jgi:hypothetical protein